MQEPDSFERKNRKNKRRTGLFLTFLLLLSLFSPTSRAMRQLPGKVRLFPGQTCTLPLGRAALSSTDEKLSCHENQLTAREEGSGEVEVSLFGLFPLHRMQVEITEKRLLIPGGTPVGLAMRSRGVMVVGVSQGSPGEKKLMPGDILLSVNGQNLKSARELSTMVEKAEGQALNISFLRKGEKQLLSLTPAWDEGNQSYRLGVWVRDSTAGVGTLTYFDPQTKMYGALGHAVHDTDTGTLFSLSQGALMKARIVDVQKGLKGVPGELRGSFLKENQELGSILSNTAFGIYGKSLLPMKNSLFEKGLPMGARSSVHPGKAQILSTVDEQGPRLFDVEITHVSRQSSPSSKSFVVKVTDPELIKKTGGIVQGMSGSPVLQDGCLIGAVTHVFVEDPLQGYGLFIEWMLQESDQLEKDAAA